MALKTPISEVVQAVLSALSNIDNVKRYWIAFSGGIDSHVLIHVLATHRHQLGEVELQAVHINHSLHQNADQWAGRCQRMCEELKLGFVAIDVDATPRTGESPEAMVVRLSETKARAAAKPDESAVGAPCYAFNSPAAVSSGGGNRSSTSPSKL